MQGQSKTTIMIRYTPSTLKKIEHIFEECQYVVRYEKGSFQSGYCLLENKRIVIVNRFFDTESRINTLLDILTSLGVDESKLSEASLEFYQKVNQPEVI